MNNRISINMKRKEKQINIDLSGANNAKNSNAKKLYTEKIFEEINQREQKPEPNYNKKKRNKSKKKFNSNKYKFEK